MENTATTPTVSKYYFVGFTSKPVCPEFLEEPTPPSNYGKEAAAKYIKERKAIQVENASEYVGIAAPDSIYVWDEKGTKLFSATGDKWLPSCKFWHWFHHFGGKVDYTFVGFRIHLFLRMTSIAVMISGENIPLSVDSWSHPYNTIDPYLYLFESTDRKHVSLTSAIRLLTCWQITEPELFNNPNQQALIAFEMAKRGQLLELSNEDGRDKASGTTTV